MKKIDKDILNELDSFEVSELQRIMEAVEAQVYYIEGYKYLSGGYSDSEITDILYGEDYDENEDKEYDLISFRVDAGVCNESGQSTFSTFHTIPRRVVVNKKMSMRDKLKKIEEA